MSRAILKSVIVGSAGGLAVAAQAAITNPGFDQGSGGLGGWTLPPAYQYANPSYPTGTTTPLAQSVTQATASGIWQPPIVWGYGSQIDPAPPGTAANNYLQLQTGPAGWSTVSQTFTLAGGETISGAFALNSFSVDGTDLSRVQVVNSLNSVVYTTTLGVNPSDYVGGSFWADPVNGSSYADWKSWSYSASTPGTYTLQFQAFSGQAGNPTDPKYTSYGLYSVAVPETSTTVAGTAAGLLTVLVVGLRRRNASV